jgi:hypothetical protein
VNRALAPCILKLDDGEWPCSRPDRFDPEGSVLRTNWTGSWMSPGACLGAATDGNQILTEKAI